MFNVTVFDDESIEKQFGIIIEDGVATVVDDEIDHEEAVLFHIKHGGIETMKTMQIEGLTAAMRFMFDGSIYTDNPNGAQKWFDILILGEEPLEKALGKVMEECQLLNEKQRGDNLHSCK